MGKRQRLGPGWAFGVNLPSCVCPGIGLLRAHQEGLGSGTQPGCFAHSTELSLYLHVLSPDYGLHALPFPDSKTKVLKSRAVPAEVEPQHLRTERAMQVSLSETAPPTICEGSCPHLWLLSPALRGPSESCIYPTVPFRDEVAQRGQGTYLRSHSMSVPSWTGTQSSHHQLSALLLPQAVIPVSGASPHPQLLVCDCRRPGPKRSHC